MLRDIDEPTELFEKLTEKFLPNVKVDKSNTQ